MFLIYSITIEMSQGWHQITGKVACSLTMELFNGHNGLYQCAFQGADDLIHLVPDAELYLSHAAMASPYVSDLVVKKLLEQNELELRNFLAGGMAQDTILGVVRGDLIKSFVHQVVPKGGKFSVRSLHTGEHAVSLGCNGMTTLQGPHKDMSLADVQHDTLCP